MIRFSLMMLTLFLCEIAASQQTVFREIHHMKTADFGLRQADLLKFQTTDVQNRAYNLQGLNKGTIISLDQDAIQSLFQDQNDFISMPLPLTDEANLVLTLKRHEIFTGDFALYSSSHPAIAIDYTPGLHYKGIVEGMPSSLVALSVFHDQIMAVITTEHGNYVLGLISGDRENNHVFYNDRDIDKASDFDCSTIDDGLGYTEDQLKSLQVGRDGNDCVRLYIEIDDDIVTDKGGAVPATDYITGLFNQSIVLYNNESINMMINEILAWTTNSPYTGSTASAMLSSYQANTGTFNANLSHLVSYAASGGIAAGFAGICNANPDLSKCFSSIDPSFQNVPTYSWSVMVVTHEMGHLIGSRHTHACVWNGNNTAIDGCAGAVEGNCPLPGNPPEGGTIMSYCHLQDVGINFNLGFGPQPGNVIRNTVNATGNCLTACGPPPPPPPPAYCASNGTNSNYEHISKVLLGSINNLSGNNGGYGNYTSLSTDISAGTTYTITLTPGFSGSSYNEFWRVWIDYNYDLDWADAGEQVGQGSGTGVVNVTFTVPAGSNGVTTKMRVSMQYNAYPPVCGSFTYGEVEDYTLVIVPASGPTCSDGIQNQGETGVDCGGPCPACPTCNDGIQNQGETGVDCGGPCPACPTCGDGIQNQSETGVDCGGPCPACPTCNDGIQNQSETGVDCGGPCPACGPSSVVLLASYFEAGWDSWLDGGSDVARVNSSNSYEGFYSIRLADNAGSQSAMTSPTFNLTNATGLQITFYFYAYSMEMNEDFWVRYNNGGGWVTIATYVRGTNFNNNTFYTSTVTVPNFTPTATGTLRIQCDASDNNDQIFIDQVTITKLIGGSLMETDVTIEEVAAPTGRPIGQNDISNPDDEKSLVLFPNPGKNVLNISFNGNIDKIRILGIDGLEIKAGEINHDHSRIDISQLSPGIYFIWVESEGEWYPSKFSKI